MKKITQSEFTGIALSEADNNIFEIYDQIPAKKSGYVYVLMKKTNYGIQEYCPRTKDQGKWTDYNNLGLALYYFDKLKKK